MVVGFLGLGAIGTPIALRCFSIAPRAIPPAPAASPIDWPSGGVAFADAPGSGGSNGAEAGTLTVMVGGSEETFRRAHPVLSAFGKQIEHLGPVGTGHAMKAVNNAADPL